MIRRQLHHPILAAAVAFVASTTAAAQDAAAQQAFAKLGKSAQQAALEKLAGSLPDTPLAKALVAASQAADRPGEARAARRAEHRGKRTIAFEDEPRALPVRVVYAFGLGTIEPVGGDKGAKPAPAAHATKAKDKGTGKDKDTAEPAAAERDPIDMQQALLGCLPGSDRALAAIERDLDGDARGDGYAAFLQSWRNGQESFYEALDRTSGTKDSVFFFDAMLDDFRGQFGGGHGSAKLAGGLQAAHDALHEAFLAYRQYRGFREAVAWSLVLPPDLPLPARLQRYEQAPAGSYSLRQQVVMVAAVLDHDHAALAKAIADGAPPLPEPIWSAGYDPYPAWNALFRGKLDAMIDRAGSSDAFLQRAQDERRELAAQIQAAAKQAIADAPAPR